MKREHQLEIGRELREELDRHSLDRTLAVLIEWGIIEADLASQILDERVFA
jgi:hypothetical protein